MVANPKEEEKKTMSKSIIDQTNSNSFLKSNCRLITSNVSDKITQKQRKICDNERVTTYAYVHIVDTVQVAKCQVFTVLFSFVLAIQSLRG